MQPDENKFSNPLGNGVDTGGFSDDFDLSDEEESVAELSLGGDDGLDLDLEEMAVPELDTGGLDDDEDLFDENEDIGDVIVMPDLSSISMEYYNAVMSLQEKIAPPVLSIEDNYKISSAEFPYLDQRYLLPLREILVDQAQAQAALPPEERMSAEENAEAVFDEMNNQFAFSVGAQYDLFIEMCARKYDNFLKLACSISAPDTPKFNNFLDMERVSLSRFVFELNGLIWRKISVQLQGNDINVTAYLNRLRRADQSKNLMCVATGPAMRAYIQSGLMGDDPIVVHGRNGELTLNWDDLRVEHLIGCLNYVLGDYNLAQVLGVSEDAVSQLSLGERLRRYVLLEYELGLLDLELFKVALDNSNMHPTADISSINYQFSADPNQFFNEVAPMYTYLCANFVPADRHMPPGSKGVSQELLYYIFLILNFGIVPDGKSLSPANLYLADMSRFFFSLYTNAPYTRLSMYYSLTPVSDVESTEFDLVFPVNDVYYNVRENSSLISAVGDQRSSFLVPIVTVVEPESGRVSKYSEDSPECPPCVVIPLFDLFSDLQKTVSNAGKASRQLRIDGVAEYRCTPSLKWMLGRSYSSQHDLDLASSGEQHQARTAHPFLNTLLSYTNDFAPEQYPVDAERIDTKGVTALYLKENHGVQGLKTHLIAVLRDDRVLSEKGTIAFDEKDDAVIMRYFQVCDGEEEGSTVLAEKNDYQALTLQGATSEHSDMPPVDAFIPSGVQPAMFMYDSPVLSMINKKICSLSALEYEEELEDARRVIMRDLKNVAMTYYIDTLLASRLLVDYTSRITPGSPVDYVNFESMRALVYIISGAVPEFEGKEKWDEECRIAVNAAIAKGQSGISMFCHYLDQFDFNVMALQGLANNDSSNEVDYRQYMALHALPDIHLRLRNLEERMVLLRILNEIGPDIAPVLRKRSRMLTAYNDITTAETLDGVESVLKAGMKGKKRMEVFPLTRKVLGAEVGGSTPILKYFALERNVHGIMATAAYSEDEQEHEIYTRLYESLGLGAEGMPKILQMDEQAFMRAPFAISLETACFRNRKLLLKLIERGLLADTSARIDLHVIKAYDLLMSYGADLFEIPVPEDGMPVSEEETSQYLNAYYSYVGSFLVSYCFLCDEAVTNAQSGSDRVVAFRSDNTGFQHYVDLSCFSGYDLFDMRVVPTD